MLDRMINLLCLDRCFSLYECAFELSNIHCERDITLPLNPMAINLKKLLYLGQHLSHLEEFPRRLVSA
jgi:hypothetical protein